MNWNFRRFTHVLVAMCLAATWSVVVTAQTAEEVETYLDEVRQKAEAGDADAQLNLGFVYLSDLGFPRNQTEAARWFRLAADQGFTEAQYTLGSMYSEGRGVPQNDVMAYMWLNLAASRYRMRTYLKGRAAAAARLTHDQRAEGQRLALEWDAAHPRG